MHARLLPALVPVLTLAVACEAPDPIEDHIQSVQLAQTAEGFQVEVQLDDTTCRNAGSFEGSRLGDLPMDYLTDEPVFSASGYVDYDTVRNGFLTADVCTGVVSFGIFDPSELEDDETVVLSLFADNTSYDIELSGYPLSDFEMLPEAPLSNATLWGSTQTFTLDNGQTLGDEVEVGLFWHPSPTEPLTVDSSDHSSVTVTFPAANPRADLGAPSSVSFSHAIAFPAPVVSAEDGSEVLFDVEHSSSPIDVALIEP